jgi:hypothetical protein
MKIKIIFQAFYGLILFGLIYYSLIFFYSHEFMKFIACVLLLIAYAILFEIIKQ